MVSAWHDKENKCTRPLGGAEYAHPLQQKFTAVLDEVDIDRLAHAVEPRVLGEPVGRRRAKAVVIGESILESIKYAHLQVRRSTERQGPGRKRDTVPDVIIDCDLQERANQARTRMRTTWRATTSSQVPQPGAQTAIQQTRPLPRGMPQHPPSKEAPLISWSLLRSSHELHPRTLRIQLQQSARTILQLDT